MKLRRIVGWSAGAIALALMLLVERMFGIYGVLERGRAAIGQRILIRMSGLPLVIEEPADLYALWRIPAHAGDKGLRAGVYAEEEIVVAPGIAAQRLPTWDTNKKDICSRRSSSSWETCLFS